MPVPQPAKANSAKPSRTEEPPLEEAPLWLAISRGVAIFFGLFILLDLFCGGAIAAPWWLQTGSLSLPLVRGVLALYAVMLLVFGATATTNPALRFSAWGLTCGLLVLTLADSSRWFAAVRHQLIDSAVRVPFSLQWAALLAVILTGLSAKLDPRRGPQRGILLGVIAFDLCLLLVPMAHIYTHGQMTDASASSAIVVLAESAAPVDSAAIEQMKTLLSTERETAIVLFGVPAHIASWQAQLQPLTEIYRIELEAISGENVKTIERVLAERQWDSVVLVGEPLTLATLHVSCARHGKLVTQVALGEAPLTLRQAMRAVPDLWREYLGLDRKSAVSELPTAALK